MSTGTASDSVKIFRPPNRLKSKVGHGSATLPATVPPTFQALVHASAAEYARHLDRQIRQLRALAAAAKGQGGGKGEGGIDADTIFTIAHQIRGEAKTFGFACVGCIADSLCKFFEAGGHGRARSDAVIVLHVDTMTMLKAESDTQGEEMAATVAQTLYEGLARAVRHVLTPCDGADCSEIGRPCGLS
ncbi:hypothetical protein [Azospirillum sp. sgz301742]